MRSATTIQYLYPCKRFYLPLHRCFCYQRVPLLYCQLEQFYRSALFPVWLHPILVYAIELDSASAVLSIFCWYPTNALRAFWLYRLLSWWFFLFYLSFFCLTCQVVRPCFFVKFIQHFLFIFLQNRWNAPISLALHAPGSDFLFTIKSIKYLRDCLPDSALVRQFATFHLYFSTKHVPKVVSFHCDIPTP